MGKRKAMLVAQVISVRRGMNHGLWVWGSDGVFAPRFPGGQRLTSGCTERCKPVGSRA